MTLALSTRGRPPATPAAIERRLEQAVEANVNLALELRTHRLEGARFAHRVGELAGRLEDLVISAGSPAGDQAINELRYLAARHLAQRSSSVL